MFYIITILKYHAKMTEIHELIKSFGHLINAYLEKVTLLNKITFFAEEEKLFYDFLYASSLCFIRCHPKIHQSIDLGSFIS